MTLTMPIHSPSAKSGLESAFAARVLGRKEARRLAAIMAGAERDARQRLALAALDVEDVFARARAEADAILAMLPDFAALEAAPAKKGKSALAAIRSVADRHGLSISAVTGTGRDDRIKAVRREAIRAVSDACPRLTDAEMSALFSGLPAATVHRYRRGDQR